jgi:hypothetical protein
MGAVIQIAATAVAEDGHVGDDGVARLGSHLFLDAAFKFQFHLPVLVERGLQVTAPPFNCAEQALEPTRGLKWAAHCVREDRKGVKGTKR